MESTFLNDRETMHISQRVREAREARRQKSIADISIISKTAKTIGKVAVMGPAETLRGPTDDKTGVPLGSNRFFLQNPVEPVT